ncbi:MAG: two-component system response regulator CreB [Akkermansiaceae bacterium]|jgi:two-component system catabolic regulation response regulator CreB|tara:strand:- start:1479 stop:2153 length:675 start_codon:yes stop_codon:yes gene_type:complete
MPSVLIVEDEPAIADTLIYALETENFAVTHIATGGEALAHFESHAPDFVVLDIGLPDFTGFDVCRTIRQSSQVPILFLTARSSEIDQILGLELGADDYVTKPFSPRAVVARVRAILRRGGSNSLVNQHSDLLSHCCETMSIHCCNQPLDLTAHEYKILAILLEQPGRVFTREQLMIQAWDDPGSAMDRTIDTHIKSLRAKLRDVSNDAAETIQTRRGLGYALVL